MSSLYVDRRDVHLQHDAGAIAFYENGQRSATVPLAPITRVILRGKVTLEASLMAHLGGRGIGVLFMTGRQGKPSLLLGRSHSDIIRRVQQTRLSLDPRFCLRYARQLVRDKLQTQCQWLPVEQFNAIINNKFERTILKPGVVWSAKELSELLLQASPEFKGIKTSPLPHQWHGYAPSQP